MSHAFTRLEKLLRDNGMPKPRELAHALDKLDELCPGGAALMADAAERGATEGEMIAAIISRFHAHQEDENRRFKERLSTAHDLLGKWVKFPAPPDPYPGNVLPAPVPIRIAVEREVRFTATATSPIIPPPSVEDGATLLHIPEPVLDPDDVTIHATPPAAPPSPLDSL